MTIEYVRSGQTKSPCYMVRATSCPVCGEDLGKYQTMGRHIVKSVECREEIAGESLYE